MAVLLLLLISGTTYAQLNYTFAQSNATYVPVSGGTVLATATGISGAAQLDNVVYTLPANSIPFSFLFNGIAYNTCFISTNGFLTFGTAPSASNTNPVSSTATYAGAVAAFGRDLIGTYRNVISTDPDTIAQLRYGVTGSAPSREFVVEWVNFRPSGTNVNPNMNFQIRLQEGSNNILLHYGAYVGSPWSNSSAAVGLRGVTNAAFANRTLTSGQPWANNTAGTSNTAVMAYTTSTVPVNGQVFSFISPCPIPVGLSLVNALPTSVTLRWSSGLPAGNYNGSTYSVEWGPSGFTPGNGIVVNTPDTFLALTGLTTGAAYQFYVRRNCAGTGNGISVAAGPRNFTTGGAAEDCSTAILIPVAADSLSATPIAVSSGISQNGPNALCSDGLGGNIPDDDRWYRFVAPANNKKIRFSTQAGTVNDWVMEVWSSCPGGSGYAVQCADDDIGGMPLIELCQNEYTPGQTYYVRLWTYSQGVSGTMNLYVFEGDPCPIPPSNDGCESPGVFVINPVLSCPGAASVFTTQFATPSGVGGANGAAPSCDPSGVINDVWLTFNTGSSGAFNLTFTKLTAPDLRAQLLFECGGFEVQCFNQASGTYTITGLNPQANYVLRVWSAPGQSGTFSVCASDACDDATAAISGFSTICSTGTAQIRFDMTGLPPWTVTYTNGTSNFSFTTSTSPYFVNVSPTVSTFYSLVSIQSPVCLGTVSGNASVTVVAPPVVTLAPFTSSVCSNTTITLTGGNPSGGIYSGTGVSGSQFNASQAGVGTHSITYTFGIGNGCQRSASQSITVIEAPVISSFSPMVAPIGSLVTITGTGFTGVNQVRFNNIVASTFTVVNATTITAVVPVGASTGFITLLKSNGCSAQSSLTFGVGAPPGTNLTVKLFIEGYYIGGGQMTAVYNPVQMPTMADSVTIELHQSVAPFATVVTRQGLLATNGTISFTYPGAQVGNAYYIVVKGRNIVETWSKNAVLFVAGNMTYDFTVPSGGNLLRMHGGNQPTGNQNFEDSGQWFKPEHPE